MLGARPDCPAWWTVWRGGWTQEGHNTIYDTAQYRSFLLYFKLESLKKPRIINGMMTQEYFILTEETLTCFSFVLLWKKDGFILSVGSQVVDTVSITSDSKLYNPLQT